MSERKLRADPRRLVAAVSVAVALGAAASTAQGQVYKCTDAAGRTSYSDTPCAPGGKPLRIPNDPAPIPAGSSVCAQMQDELNRLAASERNRASPSKRRVALHRQYAERCVGISRAPPATK